MAVFCNRTPPNILEYRGHSQTFWQPEKEDHFRHILKSLASLYESSDPHFLRNTWEIQSAPDNFDK